MPLSSSFVDALGYEFFRTVLDSSIWVTFIFRTDRFFIFHISRLLLALIGVVVQRISETFEKSRGDSVMELYLAMLQLSRVESFFSGFSEIFRITSRQRNSEQRFLSISLIFYFFFNFQFYFFNCTGFRYFALFYRSSVKLLKSLL